MIRPRRAFAAPFVLVVGCSGAATPPVPPPLRPEPLPIDAAIDAPPDAPEVAVVVADAAVDAPNLEPPRRGKDPPPKYVVDPCNLPPSPDNPTCNPGPPDAFEARIIALERTDRGLLIRVAVGEEPRVDTRWRVQLLDGAGRVVATEKLVILRADRRVIYVRVQGVYELPPDARVRLSAR